MKKALKDVENFEVEFKTSRYRKLRSLLRGFDHGGILLEVYFLTSKKRKLRNYRTT